MVCEISYNFVDYYDFYILVVASSVLISVVLQIGRHNGVAAVARRHDGGPAARWGVVRKRLVG